MGPSVRIISGDGASKKACVAMSALSQALEELRLTTGCDLHVCWYGEWEDEYGYVDATFVYVGSLG